MANIFSVKIGGAAGQGVKSAGLILAKLATRSGYQVYTHTEYGSMIKGGHNVIQVNISSEAVTAPRLQTDLLVALNQETIDLYASGLAAGAAVIFDNTAGLNVGSAAKGVDLLGGPLTGNDALLGAVCAILQGSYPTLRTLVEKEYGQVDPTTAGFGFATKNFDCGRRPVLEPKEGMSPKMVVNGNEALALGAIAGGLKFAAIYPMTPITNLLTVLASLQEKYGFVYKQPEDELAAVNMAIGASFAGSRSLTATSGGGFCLMTEGLGLAGMTETPLVIIEGMRAGPATGLPTWSEQGDLQFVLHASHGEFPRIVLAPGDVTEAFYLTRLALNLAEKYRTPVIVLVDKNLCESDQSVLLDLSKDVWEVGKRRCPGTGEYFIANSDEHTEVGYSSDDSANRVKQMEQRMNKLSICEKEDLPAPELYGPEAAKTTIVSWGSNKGAILEALKSLPETNFLHLTWLSPFPIEAVKKILSSANRIVDVEANYSGQLANLIREKTGIEITERLLKYDGRPIYPAEIVRKCSGNL